PPECTGGICRELNQTIPRSTTPASPAITTQKPAEPTDDQHKSALPPPPTSTIAKSRRKNAIAPFSIETEPGANYLIKLVNVADAKDQIMIYVKGGETYSTKVPLGGYRIRAAAGQTWYGRNDLFGPETQFFRLRGKKGSGSEDSPVFNFTQQ